MRISSNSNLLTASSLEHDSVLPILERVSGKAMSNGYENEALLVFLLFMKTVFGKTMTSIFIQQTKRANKKILSSKQSTTKSSITRYNNKMIFTLVLLFWSCFHCTTYAQQAPFYDTPKFDTSQQQHRRNMCDRQQALYNDNITLSEALQGLNLSVVLTNYQTPGNTPFFTLNPDGVIDPEHPGLFAIILDEVAARAGFSWRNSYGVVLSIDSTTDDNKTWSDLLEWEVDTFDISAGKWDRSITRMANEVSFPEGWYDSSMILIYVNDASVSSLHIWSIFLPFQWSVWLLLVVAVVVTGVAYWFLERLDTRSDIRELEHHPGDAVFYTAIAMTGHFEFQPQTTAAMILTWSTTFIALIIGAVYTANLASFLVARRVPATNIESVEQAVLMKAPICVQERVNIDDYLTNKYPEAVLVRKPFQEEMFTALKSGECRVAVLAVSEYEQYSRDSNINGDCTLAWSGRVEQIIPAGFACDVDSGTLCTSLISHVLDLHFIQMMADGFLERQWETFLQNTGTQNCVKQVDSGGNNENEETFSLGVPEMAGIFIIHTMLLGLALIVALIHYCRGTSLKKRRSTRTLQQQQQGDMEQCHEMATNKVPDSVVGDLNRNGMNGQQRRHTSLTSGEDFSLPSSGHVSAQSITRGSFEVEV